MVNNHQKWNFLIITTDEERRPPVYESDALLAFREKQLTGYQAIRKNSLDFQNHYAAATACSPSRTSIYTGQYPSLHGVSQTSGMAKPSYDPSMFYLDPNTVPTLGHYFRAAGYRTYYKGKWHLSYPDIVIPGTKQMVFSTTKDGQPVPRGEELYKSANKLSDYGFDGWIGPDPHGAAQNDMGRNRDPGFARQTVRLIEELDANKSDEPWLTVCSFTNPHDIVFFGMPWLSFGYNYDFPKVINDLKVPLPPTRFEDLSSKPFAQQEYANKYGEMFFRNPTIPQYYQLYYALQLMVDQEVLKVYEALEKSRFYENTIILYYSDHGDLLGAHGGMHQKWYNAYEEAIHVPLLVSNPQLYSDSKTTDALTSHVDLLPTLLGLAGIDALEVGKRLQHSHSEVHPLVGKDLSATIHSGGKECPDDQTLYFMTDDQVSEGLNNVNPRGNLYDPVGEPSSVETVITRLKDKDGQEEIWKYSRYFSNPREWFTTTNPDQAYDPQVEGGPAERELYNLTKDPLEVDNLASGELHENAKHRLVELQALMVEQRKRKRLLPSYRNQAATSD